MKIQFLGANRQVTGSRYVVSQDGYRLMVDCGLYQERPYLQRNWQPMDLIPDAVLLTHVHIDHCGLLPRLVRFGFRGPIYATAPSVTLAEIMLRDSARIQAEDAAYKRKRHRREGRPDKHKEYALYTEQDVETCLKLLRPLGYETPLAVGPETAGWQATLHNAGHILGSAMIRLEFPVADETRSLLFSGDVGQWGKPLIHDPTMFSSADYVVMESTYGDRDHTDGGDIETQLGGFINRTVQRGGNLVIPTFAVERAQELLYYISRLAHADKIPDVPIYLDSPMAVDVTEIFRSSRDFFDDETWAIISSGEPPLHFPGLHLVRDVAGSKAINRRDKPCIIMSTSGMCTNGRIKHHLKHNVAREQSTILFVGYQAHGTLGRQILDRSKQVRILGKMQDVRAEVGQLYGFSGHADRGALLRWIGGLEQPPRQIFLTHGDYEPAKSLAEQIQQRWNWQVSVPQYEDEVELV